MVKLKRASRALGMVLRRDSLASDITVNLSPTDRNLISNARAGLLETLATQVERLKQSLSTAETEHLEALDDDWDVQQDLFSDKDGKPTSPMDANGKLIAAAKNYELDKPPCPDEGIDPEDGVQGSLDGSEHSDVPDSFESPSSEQSAEPNPWAVVPGVPPHVEVGLIESLRNGKTRSQAVAAVSKATGISKPELDGHWDHLVRLGKIVKAGRGFALPTEPKPMTPNQMDTIKDGLLSIIGDDPLATRDIAITTAVGWFGMQGDESAIEMILNGVIQANLVKEDEQGFLSVVRSAEPETKQEAQEPEPEAQESEAPGTIEDNPIVSAILGKLTLGIASKPVAIQAVASELELSADEVAAEWEKLQFAGRITRGMAGWQVASEGNEAA